MNPSGDALCCCGFNICCLGFNIVSAKSCCNARVKNKWGRPQKPKLFSWMACLLKLEKFHFVELKTLSGALVRDRICIELRVNSVRLTSPEPPTWPGQCSSVLSLLFVCFSDKNRLLMVTDTC